MHDASELMASLREQRCYATQGMGGGEEGDVFCFTKVPILARFNARVVIGNMFLTQSIWSSGMPSSCSLTNPELREDSESSAELYESLSLGCFAVKSMYFGTGGSAFQRLRGSIKQDETLGLGMSHCSCKGAISDDWVTSPITREDGVSVTFEAEASNAVTASTADTHGVLLRSADALLTDVTVTTSSSSSRITTRRFCVTCISR